MPYSPLADLHERKITQQVSDADLLEALLNKESQTLYCGFDPTSDSLHIGNLVPLLTLRRFQLAGHKPIALVGGATGLIGDPSGKDVERQLNTTEIVALWTEKIRAQVSNIIDLENGPYAGLVENNLNWTKPMDTITFLRDIGKHFSVNNMLRKESVSTRLQENGISYTEFSYMILQSLDFLELAKRHNCILQVGGSDQWGNITSGSDLVRRILGRKAFALTTYLITREDGRKFGKTESGDSLWLSADKTSPYKFYQFWINCSDADIHAFLATFTFLNSEQRAHIINQQQQAPEKRLGQITLAQEVTRLVHGEAATKSAGRISNLLFHGKPLELIESDLEQLVQDGLPSQPITSKEHRILPVLTSLGLAKNVKAARDAIQRQAVSVNGEVVKDYAMDFQKAPLLYGRYVLIRFGKRKWGIVDVRSTS